jgi:signal transduction histidine kinase
MQHNISHSDVKTPAHAVIEQDQPGSSLAPARMFLALVMFTMVAYAIIAVYNLAAYALLPTPGLASVISPLTTVILLAVVAFCVARGRMSLGMAVFVGSVCVYDSIAFTRGWVTYLWVLWNQLIVLVLTLPFTTHRQYKNICVALIAVTVFVVGYRVVTNDSFVSSTALSSAMRDVLMGISLVLVAGVMYRVQGILFVAQARGFADRQALTQIKHDLERTVIERTQALTEANHKLSQQNALLTSLHEARLGILNHLDLHELIASILASNMKLLNAQEAVVHLTSADGSRLEMFAGTSLLQRISEQPNIKGEGLIGRVWQTGQMLAVDDYATWDQRAPDAKYDEFHACIAAPLMTDNTVMGVMTAVRTVPGRPYTPNEIDQHLRLAQIASVAYDNSRLYAAVRASEQKLEARVEARTRSLQNVLDENEALRLKAIDAATLAERSRLARELHDSVAQAVYGIALGTRAAQSIHAGGSGDIAQPLEYIVTLSETALAEIRALIFEMKPEGLKEEGIRAAFGKHADMLRQRHGVKVALVMPAYEPATSIEINYALYRVMQEATHNTIKHAHARNIALELHTHDSDMEMVICDDGIGFDPSHHYAGHHGLHNMEERIIALGGTFHVASTPGAGTRIHVRVPCRMAAAADVAQDIR